ncbi:MAG: DUF6731 family protein [Flavobacteriales bacterium]
MKGIVVHAFKVEGYDKKAKALDVIIKKIEKLKLEERVRTVGSSEMRLDSIVKKGRVYFLDFSSFRYVNAPGKASRKTDVKDIDFGIDGAAAEETAAIYDPVSNHIFVQYNHYGARHGRIGAYFSAIDEKPENQYYLETRFEKNIEQRLARKKIIKKIHFRVSSDPISKADKSAGQSLQGALKSATDLNGEYIEITIGASRIKKSSLDKKGIGATLGWLTKRMGVDGDSVTLMEVTGKEDEESVSETLNLLGNKLNVKIADIKVGPGLRYSRDDRWKAVARATKSLINKI